MKILIVMDPGILIPVEGYGGIERIIEMLSLEYVRNGHEVHLLVTSGSKLEGCIIHGYGKAGFPPERRDALKAIPLVWGFLWKHWNEFDLVHNFGRLIYLLPILNHPVKKIMSYQREINKKNIKWVNAIPNQALFFTGCSQNLINRNRLPGEWEAVYNSCDFDKYQLQAKIAEDAPLIFLGRIEKVKGCHIAIQVALATGNQLIIAGNMSALPEEKIYFDTCIAPLIDSKQIQYIGAVNDVQKNKCLGKAKALIFPIEWNEPFGIVMIEAMACGTPVVAFNRGSVNEVIEEGITGYKVDTLEGMIAAVARIGNISRASCMDFAKKRFDVKVIAKRYLGMVSECRKKIVILTTHQPAANPRAMKEYETLKEIGYSVKLLYAYNTDWSYRIDEKKFTLGELSRQDLIEVGGNPHDSPINYFISRIMYKCLSTLAMFTTFKEMSFALAAFPLWRQVRQYPAALYIAHYLGALPAALKGSKKYKAPVVFDAEDFHRGEYSYYDEQEHDVVSLEDRLLPQVCAITTASPLISAAYKNYYPKKNILTVNNVFSKRYLQTHHLNVSKELKLFWFSQHIGVFRGLEIFIEALNYLPGAFITLTIMGNNRSQLYKEKLLALSKRPGNIFFRNTAPPEEIFSIAAGYDVGLAGEMPNFKNKELCLSNKIFTYLLAGNCIVASDMQGQKEFMEQYPDIGFTYKHDEPKDLAQKIKLLYDDRILLNTCKKTSIQLAKDTLNWEEEMGPWLQLVGQLLKGKKNSLAETVNAH
ncbi:MAG: hypothetical protein JWP81_1947 [Ferruginibacter sp.]|nr:hypothetical protein [Ferruginibacter sp.]